MHTLLTHAAHALALRRWRRRHRPRAVISSRARKRTQQHKLKHGAEAAESHSSAESAASQLLHEYWMYNCHMHGTRWCAQRDTYMTLTVCHVTRVPRQIMDRADADASHAARVLVVLLAHAWHTGWGIQKLCLFGREGVHSVDTSPMRPRVAPRGLCKIDHHHRSAHMMIMGCS